MILKDLLNGLNYSIIQGDTSININKVEYDSRSISEDDLFICIEGFKTDGHDYIVRAYEKGARTFICQKDVECLEGCTYIMVDDTRKALAIIGANYYDNPSKKLKVIGITGTNGKTTSTYMMKSILEEAGYKVGLIGTIANYIGSNRIPAQRTTPESLELQKLFKEMVYEGVDYCVMEVSSHSLSLDRVFGITFDEGIFTNLTRDHLDFHKTFENYYEAKLILFKNSKNSIINIDDLYGKKVYDDVKGDRITYGIEENPDIKASNIVMNSRGIEFNLSYGDIVFPVGLNLPGKYNVYNALGSAAACINEGVAVEVVKRGLEKVFVPGRCEIVTKDYNLGFEVIVDYAHTPDGLENILKTAREFTKGRLISIFGCGGDRDKTKRPLMGAIGTELSDIAIITSDNPRTEEPMEIIKDILQGVKQDNYEVIENRLEAIRRAIEIAKTNDVIVLAGKGHEDYQVLKDKVIHFDEREIISDIIKELF